MQIAEIEDIGLLNFTRSEYRGVIDDDNSGYNPSEEFKVEVEGSEYFGHNKHQLRTKDVRVLVSDDDDREAQVATSTQRFRIKISIDITIDGDGTIHITIHITFGKREGKKPTIEGIERNVQIAYEKGGVSNSVSTFAIKN